MTRKDLRHSRMTKPSNALAPVDYRTTNAIIEAKNSVYSSNYGGLKRRYHKPKTGESPRVLPPDGRNEAQKRARKPSLPVLKCLSKDLDDEQ